MNTVSIFLYMSSVLPSIGLLLQVFGLMGVTIFFIMGAFSITDGGRCEYPFHGWNVGDYKPNWPVLIVGLVMLFFSTFIPDRETILFIAGSELSEVVVTSEEGQEMYNLLKDGLKATIDNLTDKE